MRASSVSIGADFAGGCDGAFRKVPLNRTSPEVDRLSSLLARTFMLACSVALALASITAPAGATGTMRVQKADGTVRVYEPVTLAYTKATGLTITSPNGRDAITIADAACSYIGESDILRCLLDTATFSKDGTVKPLEFTYGTLYYNRSTTLGHLPHSTQGVPGKGVVMLIKSTRGNYLSLTGTIDKEARP
jgi:hypothetical protein